MPERGGDGGEIGVGCRSILGYTVGMSLYELTADEIRPISQTTFRDAKIQERADLQRLLRERIEVIAPGCLVIAEEYGEWDESRRRIDLLAVDKDANLVVIELKRTEDGGHMELQAVRYASMISEMTFEQAVQAYSKFLEALGLQAEFAERNILDHLKWDSVKEESFAQDVRIVLASAEFSKELTSAVLWLNERGLDICCMKMSPHKDGDRVLLDVNQVIPLPEAEDHRIRVREKNLRVRESTKSGRDLTKYLVAIEGEEYGPFPKRVAVLNVVKYLCGRGVNPDDIKDAGTVRKNVFRSATGKFETVAEFIEAASKVDAERGKKFDPIRWYTEDENRIEYQGKTFALSNGWGREAVEWLSEITAAFPEYDVTIQAV